MRGRRKGKCGKRVCDIFTYNKSNFKICTALTIFASLFECTQPHHSPLPGQCFSSESGESNMSKPVNKNLIQGTPN